MTEPRAHICLYIPELDLEAHFDIAIEEADKDALDEAVSALVAMVPMIRERLSNPENALDCGYITTH